MLGMCAASVQLQVHFQPENMAGIQVSDHLLILFVLMGHRIAN